MPEQPWLVAKQLVLEDKYRQAVSLLYRASLIWYIDNSNVLIKEGYTELECLTQIVKHVGSSSQNYIKSLTINWRGLAYAHINPEKSILIELCDQWPQVMKVHSDNLNQVNIAKNSSAERSNG